MKILIKKKLFLPILFALVASFNSLYALTPVESLVLGDFSETYSDAKNDPLNYVFYRDQDSKMTSTDQKKSLALYRGFYEEGKNLVNYCRNRFDIRYPTDWNKLQAKRMVLATTQYIGIDLLTRAIPQYAKALEFSREEYVNMVEGLVGNNCSENLSIISKKELVNSFLLRFDKTNHFVLPSVENNPLFPKNLQKYIDKNKALEQELLVSVKLFQSLCSWNGNPVQAGLMATILKNPTVMSFVSRQMSGKVIDWREADNSIYLKESKDTVQVSCTHLICRRVTGDKFNEDFIFSIGSKNIQEDVNRLYCSDFRDTNVNTKDYDERIGKIINSQSLEEENLINSQFIALLSGVPDFILNVENYHQLEDVLRSSLDSTWDKWALKSSEIKVDDVFFEEPLILEQIETKHFYNYAKGDLAIGFDVNLGEFDRTNQKIGKIKVAFNIPIQESFVKHYRSSLKSFDYTDQDKVELYKKRFRLQITDSVNRAREKMLIPPWRGDLETLIVNEITKQILDTSEKHLKLKDNGMRQIRVEINYGLFALKYLNHQFNVQKSLEGLKSLSK